MNKRADRILRTTIELFMRRGIKKTTMDDIAENAKVSKVTVYKYFVDRDTLYHEIGRYVFSEYTAKLDGVVTSGEELLQKLYAFMAVVGDFIGTGQYDMCRELADYNSAVLDEYKAYKSAYKVAMLTLIDAGMEAGLLCPNLDRDMVCHYVDMGIAYFENNREYRDKIQNDAGFRDRFMAFHIGNIFREDARSLMVN